LFSFKNFAPLFKYIKDGESVFDCVFVDTHGYSFWH
jgi:hypothetical protein